MMTESWLPLAMAEAVVLGAADHETIGRCPVLR
jgi:hypothetical protein